MKNHRSIVLIVAFMCLTSALGYGGQLSIIELKHRTADEIIGIVKPLLGPDDTISGKKYVVFLTTAPENLARIESVIRALDKPSRQLLITVVQGENAEEALHSVDVSGNVAIGDNARIEFGRNPQPEGTVSIKGRSGQSVRGQKDIQRLRTQEGLPAFITIGNIIPVTTQTVDPRSRGSQDGKRVVFREVKTGFRVIPRLSGDRFILDITSQLESISSAGHGAVETQQIQTQVQGRLNEWVEIGGVLGMRQWSESGFVYSDEYKKQNRGRVFLKIVEVAH